MELKLFVTGFAIVLILSRDQAAMPRLDRPNGPGASSAKFEPSEDHYSPIAPDKVTWESIDWLRSFARVPVLLKGVLNPTDADHAVQVGASGLIVSNHGGRQLDTVPATVEALPLVVEKVAGRVPVLVDGGIRRGTDVLKALALGASAVLIGRSYLFGLALDGSKGVTRVVNLIRSEFENAMALTGRPSIKSIDRSVLWPAGGRAAVKRCRFPKPVAIAGGHPMEEGVTLTRSG